jgi:hypothetical protein
MAKKKSQQECLSCHCMHKANSIDKKKHSVASPHTHYEEPNDFGRDVMGFEEKHTKQMRVGRGGKQTSR